jgi:hypothetical protein
VVIRIIRIIKDCLSCPVVIRIIRIIRIIKDCLSCPVLIRIIMACLSRVCAY